MKFKYYNQEESHQMKVKVFAICLILVLALAVCAVAQRQGGPADQPARGRGMAALNLLNLTDAQKQQLQPILQKYRSDVSEIMKSTATPDEKKAKIDPLKVKATADIKAILTADQWDKATKAGLIDRLLGVRPGPGTPPGGVKPPPPPTRGTTPPAGGARRGGFGYQRILAQLNLTDAQKADIQKIMKASDDASTAVRNDTTLTPEAKRAKMQDIRKDTIAKIKAVLTPEQAKKFDELLKQMPGRPGGGPPPTTPPATNS